jgi:hypothetical protein
MKTVFLHRNSCVAVLNFFKYLVANAFLYTIHESSNFAWGLLGGVGVKRFAYFRAAWTEL